VDTLPKPVANTLFAAWLAEAYPEVFEALADHAAIPSDGHNLSGFMDVLTSIGGGISDAAKYVVNNLSSTVQAVGSFVNSPAGQSALSAIISNNVGGIGSATIATQAARAQTGAVPAAIQTVYNPATQTYVPVMTNAQGQPYVINPQTLQSLQPSFLSRYGLWIAGGVLGFGALYLLTRN